MALKKETSASSRGFCFWAFEYEADAPNRATREIVPRSWQPKGGRPLASPAAGVLQREEHRIHTPPRQGL